MAELYSQEVENFTENTENQLLLFKLDENKFAVDVKEITEVIEVPEIIQIPHMNNSVPGIINLRGNIIPVIDLKHHLFNKAIELENKSRIIIFSIEEDENKSLVGALVDSVDDVLNLSREDIHSAPDFGTNIKKEYIDSTTQLHESIVIILNVQKTLHHGELSDLKDSDINIELLSSIDTNEFIIEVNKEAIDSENEIEFVTFMIDEELYGIKTSMIKEIIGIEKFREVPNSLPFLKGVVNMRGEILPVIDVRSRCGLPEIKYSKKTSILIINLNGKNIGLVVEQLNDVMKFKESLIQDIPSYSANIDRDFIESMAEVNEKVIIFIDINRILSPDEFKDLSTFDTNGK